MSDFRIGLCDGCGTYQCDVRERWVMTFAGRGWDAYAGPEPPEYDSRFECPECREEAEREIEREDDAYEELAESLYGDEGYIDRGASEERLVR